MKLLADHIELVAVIITVIQILITIPFVKYLLRVRSTSEKVDALVKRFDKQESATEDALDELTQNLTNMEEAFREESKSFSDILHKINITLTKFESTVVELNKTMVRNEEQFARVVDRIYKDLDDHKKDVKDQIRDIKDNLE